MIEILMAGSAVIAFFVLVFYKVAQWLERGAESAIYAAKVSHQWIIKPCTQEDILEFTRNQVRVHYLRAIAERMNGVVEKMRNTKIDLSGNPQ